ncbi:hypothetical protein TrispH2_011776 [Trichoplax sp. H2]|nr:hypothetical protein TrispH2_011776 [Trichoplax sp. H2]|eukprot:RDD36214.1 hypothetical protein TrispH2_011776 [Trichoplax sp. H2]
MEVITVIGIAIGSDIGVNVVQSQQQQPPPPLLQQPPPTQQASPNPPYQQPSGYASNVLSPQPIQQQPPKFYVPIATPVPALPPPPPAHQRLTQHPQVAHYPHGMMTQNMDSYRLIERKQMLSNNLYLMVTEICGNERASIAAGMLLQHDHAEIVKMLENEKKLAQRVHELCNILDANAKKRMR